MTFHSFDSKGNFRWVTVGRKSPHTHTPIHPTYTLTYPYNPTHSHTHTLHTLTHPYTPHTHTPIYHPHTVTHPYTPHTHTPTQKCQLSSLRSHKYTEAEESHLRMFSFDSQRPWWGTQLKMGNHQIGKLNFSSNIGETHHFVRLRYQSMNVHLKKRECLLTSTLPSTWAKFSVHKDTSSSSWGKQSPFPDVAAGTLPPIFPSLLRAHFPEGS